MLDHSRNVVITGSILNSYVIGSDSSIAFDKLQSHTAPGAFHDSGERFDPPKCHPNTRLAVLQRLMDWIMARSDANALIMWIHGAAGAGKSAIAQTFAEMCDELGLLLGSFFFGRSDSNRNHTAHLIPTLAYQIAIKIPEYRANLESSIDQDPLIFSKSLETQIITLIVAPLQPLIDSGFFDDPTSAPRLIIIDGLDECHDGKIQSALIDLIAKVLRTRSLPFIFLISSRPSPAISHRFDSTSLAEFHTRLPLDDKKLHADGDIGRFLEDEFARIKADHPRKRFIPASWPPPDAIQIMIEKASGQFIFAAVAMKYISSIDDLPSRALDTILRLRPPRRSMPFAELDALYLHILDSAKYGDEALRILASVMLRPRFDNINFMEFILHLEAGDTDVFLADLAALVSVNTSWIHIKHASFSEFLIDSARSRSFYVDPGHYHTIFAIEWLNSYISAQFHVYASKVAERNHFNWDAYARFDNGRSLGVKTHLPLARPTSELRKTVLRCSLKYILDDSDPRRFRGMDNLGFLLRYMVLIRNLEFDDIEEMYAGILSQFDNLSIKYLDMLSNDTTAYTFLDSTLMMSKRGLGDEDIHSVARAFWREKQEPLSQIAIEFMPTIQELDILFDFIQNAQRSRHHAINSDKYTAAAVSCLHYLYNHTIFSVPSRLTLTGANMRMRRNLPWRWRQLVALNHHFRVRHRIAGIHGSKTLLLPQIGKVYGTFKLYLNSRHPVAPYPRLCTKNRLNKERNRLYIDLLRCLPVILRKANESEDVLELVNRAFPHTLPRFSREKRAVRKAIDAYVARMEDRYEDSSFV